MKSVMETHREVVMVLQTQPDQLSRFAVSGLVWLVHPWDGDCGGEDTLGRVPLDPTLSLGFDCSITVNGHTR